jgi:hypothetical protein
MGRVLRWVTATHWQRYHGHYHTRGEGHYTKLDSRVFRCKMTRIFTSSVDMWSGIPFARIGLRKLKHGHTDRCTDGISQLSFFTGSSRPGRFRVYPTEINTSTNRSAKKNFLPFPHASIEAAPMATISGRKKWPTSMESGRHFVQSDIHEKSKYLLNRPLNDDQ